MIAKHNTTRHRECAKRELFVNIISHLHFQPHLSAIAKGLSSLPLQVISLDQDDCSEAVDAHAIRGAEWRKSPVDPKAKDYASHGGSRETKPDRRRARSFYK